jgi:hypothetical protein
MSASPINPNVMPDPGSFISDSRIDKLLASEGLDERSRQWLRLSVDPFSDEQIHLEGKPTGTTLKTAVYCDPKKIQISKPTSIPDGVNWGYQITFTPFDIEEQLYYSTMTGNGVQTVAPGSTAPVGHVHIEFFAEDVSDSSVWRSVKSADMYANLSPSSVFTLRPHRIIGAGFEVRDTTAELYKQGAVTTFQSPVNEGHGTVYFGDTATPASMVNQYTRSIRMPPNTVGEAAVTPGSRSWESKHGLYMVQRLEDLDQMFDIPTSSAIVVYEGGLSANVAYNTNAYTNSSISRKTLVSGSYCGAFFSGLGDNSTFTVDYRPYIEIAPSSDDVPYINSATIAPNRCEEALELYVNAMQHLPVGVPASWNDAGDWWKAIKNVFWKVAEVASDLPIPVVSTIAKTALTAKKAYKTIKDEVKSRKQGSKAKQK